MATTAKNAALMPSASEVFSLIDERNFIQATRDSGYKGTARAASELVDNSLQAKANDVRIEISGIDETLELAFMDDGIGMDALTLRNALRFGGSTRFDDRSGMGRYGMGLPNASVSQCRRVEVYSWHQGKPSIMTYLDLDEILAGTLTAIPEPSVLELPRDFEKTKGKSGTLVLWKRCDRLDFSSVTHAEKQLPAALGRIFRNFLLGGRSIRVNKIDVKPFDPLFLDSRCEHSGATPHGVPTEVEVPLDGKRTSKVSIRFAMYPEDWQHLGAGKGENRQRKLPHLRGISVVRAGREIDYGYFDLVAQQHGFDNFWGAEIQFEPELDEFFGVTHTKQQIHLIEQMKSRLEPIVRGNVHSLRELLKRRAGSRGVSNATAAEQKAKMKDRQLRAIKDEETPQQQSLALQHAEEYAQKHPREEETPDDARRRALTFPYVLELENNPEGPFYRTLMAGPTTYVYLNTDHPFYADIYAPLALSEPNQGAKTGIELLLFALARAERQASEDTQDFYRHERNEWSNILRVYLSD